MNWAVGVLGGTPSRRAVQCRAEGFCLPAILISAALFLVLTVLPTGLTTSAHAADTTDDADFIPLRGEVCELGSETRLFPEQLIARRGDFVCPPERWASTGRHLYFRVRDPGLLRPGSGRWHILSEFVRAEKATVSAIYNDGHIESQTVTGGALRGRWAAGNYLDFPLPDRSVGFANIFIGYENVAVQSGMIRKINAAREERFLSDQRMLFLLYGLLSGILFAVCVYNLALYAYIGMRFQLYYCLTALAFLAHGSSWSGIIVYFIPDYSMASLVRTAFVSSGAGVCASTFFFIHFLEDGMLPPWIVRSLKVMALAVLSLTSFAAFAPAGMTILGDRLSSGSVLVLMAFVLTAFVIAWRGGSRAVWFAAAAWILPIIGGILRASRGSGLLPQTDIIDTSLFVGLALEALLLSIGISDRLNVLRREETAGRSNGGGPYRRRGG